MTRDERLILIFQLIAVEIKALETDVGDVSVLKTSVKANLVLAINEIFDSVAALAAGDSGVQIDDTATNGDNDVVYSADKVFDLLAALEIKIKNDLTGGASAALDTLGEIEAKLGGQDTSLANLLTLTGQAVRFVEQALSASEQAQARANIGAASKAEHDALAASMGNPDTDYVAVYNAAKS